jgi:predicted alpha/beta-fold hydrolase
MYVLLCRVVPIPRHEKRTIVRMHGVCSDSSSNHIHKLHRNQYEVIWGKWFLISGS